MQRSGMRSTVSNGRSTKKATPTRHVPHPPGSAAEKEQPLLHAASTIPKGASFDPVLALINEPATSQQYERQVGEMMQCLEQFKLGFNPPVASDGVPQIVQHFVQTLMENPPSPTGSSPVEEVIIGALTALLERCACPIVCMTLDDQRRHDGALTALLESVASALQVPQQSLRITASAQLMKMVAYIRQQCHDDVNPPPAAVTYKKKEYRKCITPSVVKACVHAWNTALGDHQDPVSGTDGNVEGQKAPIARDDSDDEGTDGPEASAAGAIAAHNLASQGNAEIVAVTRAVLELSHYSSLCEQLAGLGALDAVSETVRRCTAGDRRLTLCNEIVWNILSLHPESGKFITQQFVSTLMDAFVATLSIGYKVKERELRNDMLIVFALIARDEQNIPFFADYVELLLDLCCGHEVGVENEAIPSKFHHTTSNVEQQCKSLCWKLLDALCANHDFATYILDWGFLNVLLHYVDVHCEIPAVVRWSTLQLLDIQANVLHVLGSFAVIGSAHFSAADGARILHEYIAECPDIGLRNLAVGVLARIATTDARDDLVQAGSIPLALQLLQEGTENHSLIVDCLNLLADTVDREPELQRTFLECDGVSVVLPLLCLKPEFYTDLMESVIFAAVDCVWSCVFGEADSEAAFIAQDGIDALLSVLEDCPKWMVAFPLSCLADILQNPMAIKECREWTSNRTGNSGVQVVLSLWDTRPPSPPPYELEKVEEDTIETNPTSIPTVGATGLSTLGTQTTNNLAPRPRTVEEEEQHAEEKATQHAAQTTVAQFTRVGLDDIPEDIKPMVDQNELNFKIYAILSTVGFEDHKELSPLERGQLASVATFVDLCKDEIWKNVEESLQQNSVTPISSDAEKLRVLREAAEERSKALQRTRICCKKQQDRKAKDAEDTFYRSLIKKTDEKRAAQSKNVGLSITEAKIRKAQMLKQSFKQALGRQQSIKEETGPTEEELNAQRAEQERQEEERRRREEEEEANLNERWGLGQRAMTSAEYNVLKALNKVRTDPESLIPHLREKLTHLNEEGNAFMLPGHELEHCVEGAAVYEEAIQFLSTVRPLVTLLDVPMGLLLAARDHAVDLSRRMEVSQDGTDGSTPMQRMQRYGKPSSAASQMLSLAHVDAIDIVTQLVVDDGVENRIDRKTIFDPDMRQCGVAVGPHPIHETVNVILLAHDYTDQSAEEQQKTYAQHGGAELKTPIE